MKSLFKTIYVLFTLIVACSPSDDVVVRKSDLHFLTTTEMQFYYNQEIESLLVESKSENSKPMFCLDGQVNKWKEVDFLKGETIETANVPISSENELYALISDGQGKYLSKCYSNLTIVKAYKDSTISVYNRYLIPDRQTIDRDGGLNDYSGKLYENSLFGGLEIYTKLDGSIIAMRRYSNGVCYENDFVGNGQTERNRIAYWMNIFICKGFIVNKEITDTKSAQPVYSCPNCGEILTYYEPIGYVCLECGWNEATSMDGEIDPSIIIGGGNDSDDDDSGDDNIINPLDSGNGYGGDSGAYSDVSNYSGFIVDSDFYSYIKGAFDIIALDCMGSALINNIRDMNISFVKDSSMIEQMKLVRTSRSSHMEYKIKYNVSTDVETYILLEEMIHALQANTPAFSHECLLNIEIEAKMGAYIYCDSHGLKNNLPNGANIWDNTFGTLLNNPDETNYNAVINFLRTNQGYGSTTDFPEDSTARSMYVLPAIFSCSRYLNYQGRINTLSTDL